MNWLLLQGYWQNKVKFRTKQFSIIFIIVTLVTQANNIRISLRRKTNFRAWYGGSSRTPVNIQGERLLVVNYCCKALHFRCLRELFIWLLKPTISYMPSLATISLLNTQICANNSASPILYRRSCSKTWLFGIFSKISRKATAAKSFSVSLQDNRVTGSNFREQSTLPQNVFWNFPGFIKAAFCKEHWVYSYRNFV